MSTEVVGSQHDVGTHHSLRQKFGRFPIAPLLRALADELAQGSYLKFVTIIDPHMRDFMKSRGMTVWRFPWRHDAQVRVAHAAEDFADLVAVAETHKSQSPAVWFYAYDGSGNLLLEAEDSNDYLWLADSLPASTHEHLVTVVGGAVSRIDHVPSTLSAWRA